MRARAATTTARVAGMGGTGTAGTIAASILLLLGLTGCSQFGPPPVPSAAPTASTPTPTSTAVTGLGFGAPLHYSCDELIHPETIAELDPRLVEDPDYVPAKTTSAERAVAIGGTACRWVDSSNGTTLIVTIADPYAPTLADLEAATRSYAKPTNTFGSFGITGYTANIQMEAYTAGYWVTATSPLFSDTGKARGIMEAAIESLPS